MPEGPQVARYARLQEEQLAGKRIHADSPDGRSDDAAAYVDGHKLLKVVAVGKHLLYEFGPDRALHVHLGRFGGFDEGAMPLPEVKGVLRFRMWTRTHWYELRGAIAIEPYDAVRRKALEARIGPNPLALATSPARAFAKISKSRSPIALLVMDQSIVAGVGNIYRSEVLFLNGVHPRTPGTQIDLKTWRAMWRDFRRLMLDGEKVGRIVTTYPKDRDKPAGAVRRTDRFYVYRRDGLPCRRCGTLILTAVMGNRNVFWCPHDQPNASSFNATARNAESQPDEGA